MNTAPLSSRTRKILYSLLGVALVLHVLSAFLVFTLRPQAISTTPDPLDYRLAALNLLHYGIFSFLPPEYDAPQLVRSPGYPVMVAAGYLIDGETGLAIILFQSLLIVLSGFLLFRLLRFFAVSDGVALAVTAFFLFEPLQWLYTLHTMTETVAVFLMLAFTSAAFYNKGINTIFRAVLFGAGLGVALLIKPTFLMWTPFLLLLILLSAGSWRGRALRLGVAFLCLVLALSPYLARNYVLTGSLVLSSSGQHNLVYLGETIGIESPPNFEKTSLKTVEYNGHTNEVWLSYTAQGFEEVREAAHAILSNPHNYFPLIESSLRQVPIVWFGFVNIHTAEALGHYGVLSIIALGSQDAYARFILPFDIALWCFILLFSLVGVFALLRTTRTRWFFLPLLGIALTTIFLNFGGVWVRGLIPIYPIIALATAVGVTFILNQLSHPMPSLLRRAEHRALETVTLSGNILDLGGEKHAEYLTCIRGEHSMTTLNLDKDAHPDIIHDLELPLPLDNASYDHTLLINVLEHIFDYRSLLREASRVTRPGGTLVVIVPFLFPVHPSPSDFWRFTDSALRKELELAGLNEIVIKPLGSGIFAAQYLMLARLLPQPIRTLFDGVLYVIPGWLDSLWIVLARILGKGYSAHSYPLGYLVLAKK